jgi:transcriptional regulator with XRE-family HTH domain
MHDSVMNDTHLVRELQRRMTLARLSQKRLALMAGLNETAVRDIVTGRSQHPRHDTLQKLANALDCTVNDLIDERSGPSARTGDDAEAFLIISRFDPEADKGTASMTSPGGAASEMAFQASWLARITTTPVNQLAMITMDGDGMSPTIHAGDSLLVDLTQWSPGSDGIYVIRNNGGILVKRLSVDPLRQSVAIASDNSAYPDLEPATLLNLDLVGRVIWIGQRV